MKKLYEKYLHVPEEGRIKEKVFICRIAVAIVCMVCCLSAMGFSAYAYFTSSITSSSNIIQAASYSTDIVVKDATGTEVTPTVEDSDYKYGLGVGTYTVTLKAIGTAQKGYCKIVIGAVDDESSLKYFTVPMSPDEKESNNVITFTIECYQKTDVRIIANWGSCSETNATKLVGTSNENLGVLTIGNATNNVDISYNSLEETETDEASQGSAEESDNTNAGGQEDDADSGDTEGTTEEPEQTDGFSEETETDGDSTE